MDGMHDLGGKQGFGTVRYTYDAPAFHAAWEVRANSLYAFAVRAGLFNMDEYRHAIERMEPRHYLGASYYERSLTGLATLCVEKGVATQEELERRAQGTFPIAGNSAPGRANAVTRATFQPGDRVRVKTDYVPGHVRMPGYIRGKAGVVVGVSPAYPFPDAHAHGIASEDEPTYDVRFRSEDLWPDSCDPALCTSACSRATWSWPHEPATRELAFTLRGCIGSDAAFDVVIGRLPAGTPWTLTCNGSVAARGNADTAVVTCPTSGSAAYSLRIGS